MKKRIGFIDRLEISGSLLKQFENRYNVNKSNATMMINEMISEGRIVKKGVGKSTFYMFV